MYCWQNPAFVKSMPSASSNRSYYNILMQRQPYYIQNQPMFSSSRDTTPRTFDYPSCAKPPLGLALSSLGSPTRIDESLVYQDPSPDVLNSLPVYFRVKPTLRTPSGRRCRKSRTVFTETQLKILEKTFAEQRYLDTTSRSKLAQSLGLNETQVKTWFQNRRMKWKKEIKTTENDEAETSKTDAESEFGRDSNCHVL